MQQAGLEPHAAAAAASRVSSAALASAASAAAAGAAAGAGAGSQALPPIGSRYVTPAVAQQLQVGAQGRRNGDLGGFTPAPAYEHLYSADGQPMQVELPLGGR
jgi:hypothetical protein